MTELGQAPPASVRPAEWERLDRRVVLAYLSSLAPLALAVPLVLISTGGELSRKGVSWMVLLCLGVLALSCYGLLKYATSRYRVTEEHVELRSALVSRHTRTLRREVIRTVDVTANPLYRVLGITVVRIGTGQQGNGSSGQLSIDGVPKAAALRLRRRLQYGDSLDVGAEHTGSAEHTGGFGHAAGAGEVGPARQAPGREATALAELSWSWLRFAPLSMLGVGGFIAVLVAAHETLRQAGIDPLELPVLRGLGDWGSDQPVWLLVLIISLVALVLGVLGTLLTYVEAWWGFTLEREGQHLRVQRGLLTTRSFSIDRERLLGVEVAEPLALRWGGGARTKALVAGLRDSDGEGGQPRNDLLPPAPRARSLDLTTELMGPVPEFLTPHPPAALRRRRLRAAAAVLATASACALSALLWAPLLYVAAGSVLVLGPAGWWLAGDAYRALGHAVTEDRLVVRSGTWIRRTVIVRRASVIGWTLKQSPAQRRSGLATLVATVAAGDGTCEIRDLALADVPDLAERAVPRLFPPFDRQS